MKVKDLFLSKRPLVSFEFFPPKTEEGMEHLMDTITDFKALGPSFVSMTYGAGGSTREKTTRLVRRIKNDIGLETMAHLTCVGHDRTELKTILKDFQEAGIDNIMALRGDPPKGQSEFVPVRNGFRYASELVSFIRQAGDFCIGVAGYPEKHVEAPSLEEDLIHLKEKVEAGADFIVTQLFFDNKDYFDFVQKTKALGIQTPILAGIMPVKDLEQTQRFSTMCGAKIPAALRQRLEHARHDPEGVIRVGIDHATAQCEDLLKNGVSGIHFYTLNKSLSTVEIFKTCKRNGLV